MEIWVIDFASSSSLPSSKLIRILRMSDPERGQTTLPFRPVTQEEEDDQSWFVT